MEATDPALTPEAYALAPYAAPLHIPWEIVPVSDWQLPADSPWAPYEKQTLLSALEMGDGLALPDVRQLEVVQRAVAAARTLSSRPLPPDTMWIIDLRGAASVAFATTLGDLAPVVTFNNWPAMNETVPAEEALSALLTWHPTPHPEQPGARPAFILDAWRLAYVGAKIDDSMTDNRYLLSAADLPDVQKLWEQGIRRVVYVVESVDESPVEADDLNATFLEYQGAGLAMSFVDLQALSYWPRVTPGWQAWLGQYEYRARARPTIVSDPLFYGLSPGGFGGAGAAPSGHGGHGGG
jgi:hypothetical protein